MSRKRLARAIGVCIIAIMIIVAVTILPSCVSSTTTPTLVTYNCTGQRTSSLRGQGEVKDIGAGLLSRRGFVWLEGDSGDPVLNLVLIENPSFESGDPPEGWAYRNSTQVSRVSDVVKVGSYALQYQYPGGGSFPYVIAQQTFNITGWAGKTLTVGAWVKSNSASTRLGFAEWGGAWWSTGSYHPGDGEWHWLRCSATIPTDLTANWTIGVVNYNTTASYTFGVDDVVLVKNAVFEVGSFDIGTYSLDITNLKSNTSYRIRAFGENDKGIGYGNTVTCQTK